MSNEHWPKKVERRLGELSAKVDMILNELHSIKDNLTSLTERITRCEERIDDCEKQILTHLRWHARERSISFQWRIALFAGLIALASSLLSVFLAKII
ncbi:MAG TPA: hypothetical protein ENG16_01830, partial [Archaeoglobus sp.]|nr:hypothetical protein [Archaeoglobus sp.]